MSYISTSSKTFSVLIATIGRSTLQNMLDSLLSQLTSDDCLTIVFDGHVMPPTGFYFSKFKCKISIYCEATALGYWGHGIRNKYASLIEKRDFVIHADDDNAYIPDAFKIIRKTCIDENTLYIFKMALSPTLNYPQTHEIRENNIDTGIGAIPFELNKKGSWLCRYGGMDHFMRKFVSKLKR